MKTTTEQMDASQVFCPNLACVAHELRNEPVEELIAG
jgi:hypothetical protein